MKKIFALLFVLIAMTSCAASVIETEFPAPPTAYEDSFYKLVEISKADKSPSELKLTSQPQFSAAYVLRSKIPINIMGLTIYISGSYIDCNVESVTVADAFVLRIIKIETKKLNGYGGAAQLVTITGDQLITQDRPLDLNITVTLDPSSLRLANNLQAAGEKPAVYTEILKKPITDNQDFDYIHNHGYVFGFETPIKM